MKPPIFNDSWDEEVRSLYRHDVQEIWDSALNRSAWNQYHAQLELYRSYAQGGKKRILDVGCAQATLAMLLAEEGHEVVAVDLRKKFLQYAKSRYTHGKIEFVETNVLDVEMPGKFDLIYANQIIEHLVHPQQMVSRLAMMLNEGGRLVVTTPNHSYLRNGLPTFTQLGDVAKYESKQFTADGDGHFFAYTREELLGYFSVARLCSIRSVFFETPLVSGHMKMRYLHAVVPYKPLLSLDRVVRALPIFGRKLSHQLLITATK
jgi:2-polyprenyl-3-methyl-5-hydroxy-6-metoxy-1,4-benzoquinol methylase